MEFILVFEIPRGVVEAESNCSKLLKNSFILMILKYRFVLLLLLLVTV